MVLMRKGIALGAVYRFPIIYSCLIKFKPVKVNWNRIRESSFKCDLDANTSKRNTGFGYGERFHIQGDSNLASNFRNTHFVPTSPGKVREFNSK